MVLSPLLKDKSQLRPECTSVNLTIGTRANGTEITLWKCAGNIFILFENARTRRCCRMVLVYIQPVNELPAINKINNIVIANKLIGSSFHVGSEAGSTLERGSSECLASVLLLSRVV